MSLNDNEKIEYATNHVEIAMKNLVDAVYLLKSDSKDDCGRLVHKALERQIKALEKIANVLKDNQQSIESN